MPSYFVAPTARLVISDIYQVAATATIVATTRFALAPILAPLVRAPGETFKLSPGSSSVGPATTPVAKRWNPTTSTWDAIPSP